MDKDGKNQGACRAPEPELLLQWGNRKKLRCVKVRHGSAALEKPDGLRRTKTRVNRRVIKSDKDSPLPCPWLHAPSSSLHRKSESGASESNRKSPSSPDKEDGRFYATRGSLAGHEENGHGGGEGDERGGFGCGVGEEKGRGRWVPPRFFISLSSKEKEEDFMAMKGCKLPQRPKKRAKFIQKIILLVSPGAGLSDLSQERYEVREKKNTRKVRRALLRFLLTSEISAEKYRSSSFSSPLLREYAFDEDFPLCLVTEKKGLEGHLHGKRFGVKQG